jgi:hypothetical protein
MAELTPLNDPSNIYWETVPKKDTYAKGMTVEDAYRFLDRSPRRPIDPSK